MDVHSGEQLALAGTVSDGNLVALAEDHSQRLVGSSDDVVRLLADELEVVDTVAAMYILQNYLDSI